MEVSDQKIPKDFHKQILKALKARHRLVFNEGDSLIKLNLVKHYREIYEPDDNAGRRAATNQLLDEAIGRLRSIDENAANIIEWRFIDGKTVDELTNRERGITKDVFMPKQREAMKQLATIVWDMEVTHRGRVQQELQARLPRRVHGQLVGIDDVVGKIVDLLINPEKSNPVIIHGIGGIGKTTLAETAVNQLINQLAFTQLAWVTIQNESLTNQELNLDGVLELIIGRMGHDQWLQLDKDKQIQHVTIALKNRPHLIIIDNNESPIDSAFIAQLNDWSGISRFLLTSRYSIPDDTGWETIAVDELSLQSTTELIRAQAQRDNVEVLTNISNEELQPIYDAVGGNPQAIKLVVGLTRTRPLSAILSDIPKASSKRIESLYTHIYWEAWQALSENGRSLLQLMFSSDEMGYDAEDLNDFSTLAEGALWDAVDELMERSLMDKSYDIDTPYYSIHRLTASFLQTEIINWPELPGT